jgi:hypothetical protein
MSQGAASPFVIQLNSLTVPTLITIFPTWQCNTNTNKPRHHHSPHPLTSSSLPQPHLDRTALCRLNDTELDKRYITQRDGLRQVVQDRAHAKVVGGQQLTGKALARLLQTLIAGEQCCWCLCSVCAFQKCRLKVCRHAQYTCVSSMSDCWC